MVSETTWIENSREFNVSSKVYLDIIVFITLSIAVLVIIHSWVVHRCKCNVIRLYTELSCYSTLLTCICFLCGTSIIPAEFHFGFVDHIIFIASAYPTQKNFAILIDVLCYGFLRLITQLAAVYLVYFLSLAVKKISMWQEIFIQSWIWILLVLTFLPMRTIIPCFINLNNKKSGKIPFILEDIVFICAYLLFNLYFAARFLLIMQLQIVTQVTIRKTVISISYRNIVLIFISSIGIIALGLENILGIRPLGLLLSQLSVFMGLHFLFNWTPKPSRYSGPASIQIRNIRAEDSIRVATKKRHSLPIKNNKPLPQFKKAAQVATTTTPPSVDPPQPLEEKAVPPSSELAIVPIKEVGRRGSKASSIILGVGENDEDMNLALSQQAAINIANQEAARQETDGCDDVTNLQSSDKDQEKKSTRGSTTGAKKFQGSRLSSTGVGVPSIISFRKFSKGFSFEDWTNEMFSNELSSSQSNNDVNTHASSSKEYRSSLDIRPHVIGLGMGSSSGISPQVAIQERISEIDIEEVADAQNNLADTAASSPVKSPQSTSKSSEKVCPVDR